MRLNFENLRGFTSMNIPKRTVLRQLADMVRSYIPLEQANIATLGGEGLEVSVWKEAGVPENHLWLIERKINRSQNLVRMYPDAFHIHGQLSRFPGAFEAHNGLREGLEYFHWDLCGTLEPVINDLRAIFPLVLRGQAKCLAITVADARRNRSLEEPEKIMQLAQAVFGNRLDRVEGNLRLLHKLPLTCLCNVEANPDQVTLRELAVLLNVFLALTRVAPVDMVESYLDNKLGELPHPKFLPDRLERFIYHSDSPNNFRMRTYFLHIADVAEPPSMSKAGRMLANLILSASCTWVDGETVMPMLPDRQFAESTDDHRTVTERKGIKLNEEDLRGIRQRLRPVMALSPAIKQDIQNLLAAVTGAAGAEKRVLDDMIQTLERKRARLDGRGGNGPPSQAQIPVPEAAATEGGATQPTPEAPQASQPEPVVPTRPAATKPRRARDTMTDAEKQADLVVKDGWRVELLRAKKEGEEAFAKKFQEVCKKLDLPGDDFHSRRVMGSIMAHTNGQLLPKFVLRLQNDPAGFGFGNPGEIITEIAGCLDMPVGKLKTAVRELLRKREG